MQVAAHAGTCGCQICVNARYGAMMALVKALDNSPAPTVAEALKAQNRRNQARGYVDVYFTNLARR